MSITGSYSTASIIANLADDMATYLTSLDDSSLNFGHNLADAHTALMDVLDNIVFNDAAPTIVRVNGDNSEAVVEGNLASTRYASQVAILHEGGGANSGFVGF